MVEPCRRLPCGRTGFGGRSGDGEEGRRRWTLVFRPSRPEEEPRGGKKIN